MIEEREVRLRLEGLSIVRMMIARFFHSVRLHFYSWNKHGGLPQPTRMIKRKRSVIIVFSRRKMIAGSVMFLTTRPTQPLPSVLRLNRIK